MIERKLETAVVTGPTGVIGIALCKVLINKGIQVYAVVRPNSQRKKKLPKEVNIIECDLSDIEKLNSFVKAADVFFHLAWNGTTGISRNDMLLQVSNIKYAVKAVDVAKKIGCKVFIGVGSQAEYGRVSNALTPSTPCYPENGYGIAKLCASEMTRIECEQKEIEHIWLRVLSVYGPNDGKSFITSAIMHMLNGEVFKMTPGEQMWDYLYAEDAAEALLLSAIHGVNGKTYVVGSGKTQKLRNYVNAIHLLIAGSKEPGIGEIQYSENQVMFLQADISSLSDDTGFFPKVSFEEGIKKTIDSIKGEMHEKSKCADSLL